MKKLIVTVFALVGILMLSGCVNQSPIHAVASRSPTAQRTAPNAPSPPKKAPLPEVQAVRTPWTEGAFQKGVQVYWHTNHDNDDDVALKADTIFNYVVGLGANSVGINFPVYVDGQRPTRTYADAETPNIDELKIVLRQAKLHKLRVVVRPVIDEKNIVAMGASYWRGTIEPADPHAWFASYGTFLEPYLDASKQEGVDEFVLGTELSSLQTAQGEWDQLKANAQRRFSGKLSFSINWTTYQQNIPGPFEETGLDAYPQFPSLSDDATVEQVSASWNQWLAATRATGRSMALQEVGIPAQPGVYKNPANWGSSQQVTASGERIQATWFTAACQAAHAQQAEGIYFWNVDINADVTGASRATESTGSFIGRAGEAAIKQCFAQ